MRKAILTVVGASVIAILTAQAAAASEHQHTRTKGPAVASEQWRDSNAYAAPRGIALPSYSSPSYSSSLGEGAMSSGMAGH
jgi:Ni/Co efflux regulator RcnB